MLRYGCSGVCIIVHNSGNSKGCLLGREHCVLLRNTAGKVVGPLEGGVSEPRLACPPAHPQTSRLL